MKPGRELDAVIHEKVFGRTVRWERIINRVEPCLDDVGYLAPCPAYSTSIARAWEVFQMSRFDGWYIGREASGKWKVCIPCWDTTFSHAETAPHAICLAALKAVRYTPPSGGLSQTSNE